MQIFTWWPKPFSSTLIKFSLPTFFMLFRILWTAISQSFPFESEYSCKICLHLPKPVNRAPWWEGDICLAWFRSRSPQDTRLPSGGRRVWDSQQRTVFCQPICVTDVPQHWQTSVNVKTRLCRHLLSAAIFGWWKVSRSWAGLVSRVQRRPVPRLFVLAPGWLRGGIRGRRQGLDDWNAAQTGAPFTTMNQQNRGKARPILSVTYSVRLKGIKALFKLWVTPINGTLRR